MNVALDLVLTSHDINYTGEASVCVYEVVLNHLAAYTYGTVHTMLFYYKTFKDGQTVSGLTNLVVLFLNSGFRMNVIVCTLFKFPSRFRL